MINKRERGTFRRDRISAKDKKINKILIEIIINSSRIMR